MSTLANRRLGGNAETLEGIEGCLNTVAECDWWLRVRQASTLAGPRPYRVEMGIVGAREHSSDRRVDHPR